MISIGSSSYFPMIFLQSLALPNRPGQASVPSHLEDQLSRLEAVADEFRAWTLRYLDQADEHG